MLTGIVSFASAQVAGYSFSQSTVAFDTLTTGKALTPSTSTTGMYYVDSTVIAGSTATTSGIGLPIGFTFNFNGSNFDLFGINANGWISFGQSVLAPTSVNMNSSASSSPISSTSTATAVLQNRVSSLGRNLLGQVGSKLSYGTIGTAPNRILVVEWMHFRRNNTATTEDINLQIKLYETSNIVEFIYGNVVYAGTGTGVQVGLRGQTNADFNNRAGNTDWSATTAGTINTSTVMLSNLIYPDSGLVFSWAPPSPNDAGITAINSPVAGTVSGTQDFAVTLKNFGADTLFDVDIAWSVNGVLQTPFAWSDTLPYFQSEGPDTIGTFNFITEGNNIIKVWTENPNGNTDGNNNNDTATVIVFVLPANDMAAIEWVAPLGGCGMTSSETVTAKFTNAGSAPQSNIPVYYSIDGGQTIVGPEIIAGPVNPGDTITYSFTATADFSTPGNYNGGVVVGLTTDFINTNDTVFFDLNSYGIINTFPFVENFNHHYGSYYLTLANAANAVAYFDTISGVGNSGCAHLSGNINNTGWTGTGTQTAAAAYGTYTTHHSVLEPCQVDATGLTNLAMEFDLRQTYISSGNKTYSWLVAIANGTDTLADVTGKKYFNPLTSSADTFTTKKYNLSAYAGSAFTVELKSACKYNILFGSNPGDNAFIDNFTVMETVPPAVDLGNDTGFCAGGSMLLDAGDTQAGYTYTYAWSTLLDTATFATTQTVTTDSAATYVVIVDNGYGQTDSDTIVISEYALPVVSLGPDTTNCPPITLDPGAGYDSYAWSTTETTQTIEVTSTGTFWVDVTNSFGCVSRDSIDVTVNPLPLVNAGTDQTFCYLDTLDIVSATASDYSSLLWTSTGDGHFNDSTLLLPYYVPGATDITNGSVDLVLTAYAFCDTVNSQITVTITTSAIADAGTDATICLGESAQLSAIGGATYSWTPITGLNDPNIANPVATPGSTTTYTVSVTSSCGTATDDVVVTVNSTTPPDLGNDTAICNGSSITFDAGAYNSYSWNTGETTQTIDVNSAGAIIVIVTGPNTCTATDTVNVIINPLPVVQLPADTALCGTQFIIIADTGYTNYIWNDITPGTNTFTATTSGDYFVNVTDSLGCSNYSDTIHVTLYPTYSITNNPIICQGESYFAGGADQTTSGMYYDSLLTSNGCDSIITTNLTVKPLPVVDLPNDTSTCGSFIINAGAGYASYLWNDTIVGTNIFTATEDGSYFVFVTDSFGCSNYSDTVQLSITPNPPIDLPDTTIPLSNGSVLLDAGLGFDTYHWSTGATTHLIVVFGNYLGVGTHHIYVTATAGDGCASFGEAVITVFQDAGIDPYDMSSLLIYPNPADNSLYIDGITGSGALNIQISDELGQIVLSTLYDKNQKPYSINVSTLSPGIYTIRIMNDEILTTRRFIKQ
jgi:hypothetical protein